VPLRVVVDPGVFVSALISDIGAPAEIVRRWLAGAIEIVACPHLLAELDDTLGRRKFRRWMTEAKADRFIEFLGEYGVLVDDPPEESGHSRDPDDDYLVSLALAADASILVSGDKDLIDLREKKPVVMTPRQLIEMLDQREAEA
jgi:putative PIN family toxin of toxin-antitoxin system